MSIVELERREVVAAGGVGQVFLGTATFDDGRRSDVAIKTILPHLRKDERFVGMFEDEGRLCQRLEHPNIVRTLDVTHEPEPMVIMEFIDGVHLGYVVKQLKGDERQLARPMAIHVVACVLDALGYAHTLCEPNGIPLSIVHRDVSPENIMLSADGRVILMDFGMARARTQVNQTQQGVIKGKYGYLAPEALAGDRLDKRADLYSASVVLWECLAGRRLFDNKNLKDAVGNILHGSVTDVRSVNPKVDEALAAVVSKGLERDRGRRYSNANQFSRALRDYLAERQLAVTPEHVSRLVRWARSRG